MSVQDYAAMTTVIIGVGGVAVAVLGWSAKHWLKDQLKEIRPNGGESTVDKVREAARDAKRAAEAAERVAQDFDDLKDRVSNIEQVIVKWTPRKQPARRRTSA